MHKFVNPFLLLIVFEFFVDYAALGISVPVSNLSVGETKYHLISSTIEDIYRVVYNSSNTTLNVTAWTNTTSDLPLLIVIRQEKGLISLQLPDKETSRSVQHVSRILCPAYVSRDSHGLSTVYIDIYTSSLVNVSYSLKVDYFQSFVLSENSKTSLFVSPFAPVFFKYDMKYQGSIVKFTSDDRICTTVSVQRMMCPVFDLKHTIDFAGQYQTMTKLAAIYVDNPAFVHKSMYIVISVHPTDRDCCDSANCSGASFHRIKKLEIELLPGHDGPTVSLNYAITLSVFMGIYLFICPFLCLVEPYSEKNLKALIHEYKTTDTMFTASTAVTPSSSNKVFACGTTVVVAEKSNKPKSQSNNNNLLIIKQNETGSLINRKLKHQQSNTSSLTSSCSQNKNKEASCQSLEMHKEANPAAPSKEQGDNETPDETINVGEESSKPVADVVVEIVEKDETESSAFLKDNATATIDLRIAIPPIVEENSQQIANEDNSSSSVEAVDISNYSKQENNNRPNLRLHDLARKQAKLVDRKINNYPRLIIAIATFYVLPVIQLVLLYQTQLNRSGNEDSCYFNFLCLVKSGPFVAFNNVFSNVGYVLLGVMFIIVVKKRSYSYAYIRKKYPHIMITHGVPQHFGLFYTMGIGLIMEGILSAAYHVCPSFNNFQFDTSFMYVIGVIVTIKLYQSRHPDMNPSSQKVFLFLALCILLNVISVFYGKQYSWFVLFYSIAHILFFFCLSVTIYYMKQPKLEYNIIKEMAQNIKKDKQIVYIDRLIMLIIANIFNVGMGIYAILTGAQFSSHLLYVLLGNFMLYFFMYLINKVIRKEPFHPATIVTLIIFTISWMSAVYLYSVEIKQWDKKPAESREANKDCVLLGVFDHHDVWHLLSSLSMFMLFVVMLTIDDGIITKKRSEITVF